MWLNHSDFKILRIVEGGQTNEAAVEIFMKDFLRARSPADRKIENYSEKNFLIRDHFIFSALYTKSGDFVLCCGVFNGGRWPDMCFRILNRCYYSEKYRVRSNFKFLASRFLLPFQLEVIPQETKLLFVSREGPMGHALLRRMRARVDAFCSYQISESFIHTVPKIFEPKCFQKILYKKLTPEPIEFSGVFSVCQNEEENLKALGPLRF